MILLYIIFCFIVIFLVIYFIKKRKMFHFKYKEFLNYLFRIEDMDTYYALGGKDEYGNIKTYDMMYWTIEDKLLEKFEKTNDPKYMIFNDVFMSYCRTKFFMFISSAIVAISFVIIREFIK